MDFAERSRQLGVSWLVHLSRLARDIIRHLIVLLVALFFLDVCHDFLLFSPFPGLFCFASLFPLELDFALSLITLCFDLHIKCLFLGVQVLSEGQSELLIVVANGVLEHVLHVLHAVGLLSTPIRVIQVVDVADGGLAGLLVRKQVQVVLRENLGPNVSVAGQRIDILFINVERDRLLRNQAVWDLVLSEALEVNDQAEVRAYLVLNLLQRGRKLREVLWELDWANEHPMAVPGTLQD